MLKGQTVLRSAHPALGFNYTPHSWAIGRTRRAHSPWLLILQAETGDHKKSEWGFKSMVHFTSNETPAFVSSPLKGFIFLNGFILYSAPLPYSISRCGYTNNGRSIYLRYRFSLLVALQKTIDKWKFFQVFKKLKHLIFVFDLHLGKHSRESLEHNQSIFLFIG